MAFRWRVTLVCIIAVASIAGLLLLVFLNASREMLHIDVYEPPMFVTASDASASLKLQLPPEARNIRFAGYRQWIAAEDYLRFDAPVDVCLRYAWSIVADQPLAPVADGARLNDGPPTDPTIFHDISWFDLRSATNLVSAGGGSHKPRVWVDQSRGVFYYRMTD